MFFVCRRPCLVFNVQTESVIYLCHFTIYALYYFVFIKQQNKVCAFCRLQDVLGQK